MQIDLQKILSISGYPGLYKYVSQARNGIIVESLVDKKRMCAGTAERVSSLGDISIYTDTDDVALKDILLKIKEKHNSEVAISHKVSPDELKKYFEDMLPDYDRERVYPSHIKKVIEWYNILQKNDMLEFIEDNQQQNEEETA
ncbi:MAG: DUF5606 domain-containing protein [Prevotellaceae bacterium]|jgi:hypothetical protein|nr:DUF5606 domain-containing protein [Prevotellaceae bacterium]